MSVGSFKWTTESDSSAAALGWTVKRMNSKEPKRSVLPNESLPNGMTPHVSVRSQPSDWRCQRTKRIDISYGLLQDSGRPAGQSRVGSNWSGGAWGKKKKKKKRPNYEEKSDGCGEMEQQMSFVWRFCKATSVMDCFICSDLQAYLEKRKEEIKRSASHFSFLAPRP